MIYEELKLPAVMLSHMSMPAKCDYFAEAITAMADLALWACRLPTVLI